MSVYLSSLSAEVRSRYIDKLHGLGFKEEDDPYTILECSRNTKTCSNASEWKDDVTLWPTVEFGSIYTYLIDTPGPYTRDNLHAHRSLDAYNFFISGWVQTCFYRKNRAGNAIIAGKVLRSQAVTNEPHQAWVGIRQKDGMVLCGHCTCMAGLGEVCSHIAAVLFKVESNSRLGHNQQSCTSVPCQWNQTFAKKVEPALIKDINFIKPKRGRNDANILSSQECDLEVEDPGNLLNDLKACVPNAVVFSIVQPKKTGQMEKKYPPLISNLHDPKYKQLCTEELAVQCDAVCEALSTTQQQSDNLEKGTTNQAKSGLWHRYRQGRITASTFYDACHTNIEKPAPSLIKNIVYRKSVYSDATNWGMDQEDAAVDAYYSKSKGSHQNLRLRKCGFVINPSHPYLGASPDMFIECDCCGQGVLEVKCPYKHKDTHPCEVIDPMFCLHPHSECCDNQINFRHKYFYQVQGQMGITNTLYCDFVVFTTKGVHTERVLFDSAFFNDMLLKLSACFKKCVLPEVLTHKLLNETKSVIRQPKKRVCCRK